MYYALSIGIGALIALMIALNGGLTSYTGVYPATVVIHSVGSLITAVWLLFKREGFLPKKKMPLYLYFGGVVGVCTTLFNNLAFGVISVSAILALGLLGQSVTSLVIDQFGLLNTKVRKFDKKKILGLLFIVAGILLILVL